MGILDEAIREHLELKRQHGAESSELQKIEDEAFGPPARPGAPEDGPTDAEAEAPTEFMALGGEPQPAPEEYAEPAVEEHPAAEHATQAPEGEMPEPESEAPGSETEERRAIAEQPTELHDMEAELGPPEPTPSESELLDAQAGEPRLESAQPAADDLDLSGAEAVPVDEDDDFFDEQSLSDELDQALESPPGEDGIPEAPESVEEEPEPVAEEPPAEEPEAAAEEPQEPPAPAGDEEDAEEQGGGAFFDQEGEDVLEETPEFLQDTPEHDRLWFEQKPPKDFDFDD